jgi:hypothetical protein
VSILRSHPVYVARLEGEFCGHQHTTGTTAVHCALIMAQRSGGALVATISEVGTNGAESVIDRTEKAR